MVDLDVDATIILKWKSKDGVGAVEWIRLALNSSCDNGHGSWGCRERDNLFTACGIKS